MEYLVMECHRSYAVVLDRQGRFKKVANLQSQVGQEVSSVVELRQPRQGGVIRWQPLLTAAACLCIVFAGIWQTALLSMGTVLIQINPQIRLSVNRMERVISAEAVNPDGAKVLFDYHPFGKTVEQVAQGFPNRSFVRWITAHRLWKTLWTMWTTLPDPCAQPAQFLRTHVDNSVHICE